MRPFFLTFVALLALWPVHGFAQARLSEAQRNDMQDHLHNMTPEQRKALTAQARTKWDNLTPAQQSRLRDKAEDRYDQMTPEQKAALRKRFRDMPDHRSH